MKDEEEIAEERVGRWIQGQSSQIRSTFAPQRQQSRVSESVLALQQDKTDPWIRLLKNIGRFRG